MACYNDGWRYHGPLFLLFARAWAEGEETTTAPFRLGVGVSRKTGPAVVRNRVKRLVREWFRLNQDRVPTGRDYVVVPKKGLDRSLLTYARVETELGPLVARAERPPVRAPRPSRSRDGRR